MYNNTLTSTRRDKIIEYLIKRDGNQCFYCAKLGKNAEFVPDDICLKRELDHLNNNANDNRIINFVLCHAMCNEKKKTDYDIKILASDKLKENMKNADHLPSLSERERERGKVTDTNTDEFTEADMNKITNSQVTKYLEEKVPRNSDNCIPYSMAIRDNHCIIINKTGGRGSEVTVRRSLDARCISEYGNWEVFRDDSGQKMIRRRANPLEIK